MTNMTDFVSISFEIIEKFAGGEGLDLYIKVGDEKHLKVCHEEESHKNIIQRYQARGADCFYLTEEDYQVFIERVRRELTEKVTSEKGDGTGTVKDLNSAYVVLRSVFGDKGISDEGKSLAKEIARGSMKVISGSSLVGRMRSFIKDCNAEYLQALLTSFVACNIIDTFPWGNVGIKEKVVMASLFCDILLSKEDFQTILQTKGSASALPPHIISHPLKTADALAKETRFIAPETIVIIRQHHERPNGKGYPKKMSYNDITLLTAVYIVANYFVEQVFRQDCTEGVSTERLMQISDQINGKFFSGCFRKVSEALESILF